MDFWIQNYIATILIAIVMASLIIPKVLQIAHQKRLFDTVEDRKVHKGVVPRLGGISFVPAMGISLCLVIGFDLRLGAEDVSVALSHLLSPALFAICGTLLIYLVGVADDLVGVRYRAKFLFQILAGVLFVCGGMEINHLYGFCGIHELSPGIDWLLTIFLVIYVLNAINLIDGIDGLSSGLSMMALGWYSYVFYEADAYGCLLICGATLGTLIPFFYFNVFGCAKKRTKIFMGDTGALSIGLVLVFLTIAVLNLPMHGAVSHENKFIVAVAPLLVPCFDVVRVFFHRLKCRRHPFMSDSSHIHHKLLCLGIGQRKALIVILSFNAVLMLLNLWLSECVNPTWIIAADIGLWTGANIGLTHAIRQRERETGRRLYL